MKRIGKLKKLLKKEKKKKEEIKLEKELPEEDVLAKVVERMKEKYVKEGLIKEKEEEVASADLKKMIEGAKKIEYGASPRELTLYDNSLVRAFGKMYLALEAPLSLFVKFFKKKMGESLKYDLLASGMNYSIEQYLALVFSASFFTFIISFVLFLLLWMAKAVSIVMLAFIPPVITLLVMFLMLTIPRSKANKIANEIDKELPFALRHMSIEIRAGVSIYKTLESVAMSGYGPLSTGLKWVLSQVEKGKATEDVLEEWAQRTKSEALKRVVSHIVRALRTGGNLSDIMVTIAEDVSFERRAKIADFAEKLNLIGLFLMMSIVVLPVMVSILTTIASAPSISQYLGMLSFFSPSFLMLLYFVLVPGMMFVFMYYIKSADPG